MTKSLDGGLTAKAPRTPLVVVDYDPAWPLAFEAARAEVLSAVGPHVEDVEHAGSTSVVGLAAKPIIDILVGVRDWHEARITIAPLERVGWEFRGQRGIPRRHYFVIRTADGHRTHHLHMLERTSAHYADMLAFRNHLRTHPSAATEYATLKRQLARFPEPHRGAYQHSKAPFIQRVLCELRTDALAACARPVLRPSDRI